MAKEEKKSWVPGIVDLVRPSKRTSDLYTVSEALKEHTNGVSLNTAADACVEADVPFLAAWLRMLAIPVGNGVAGPLSGCLPPLAVHTGEINFDVTFRDAPDNARPRGWVVRVGLVADAAAGHMHRSNVFKEDEARFSGEKVIIGAGNRCRFERMFSGFADLFIGRLMETGEIVSYGTRPDMDALLDAALLPMPDFEKSSYLVLEETTTGFDLHAKQGLRDLPALYAEIRREGYDVAADMAGRFVFTLSDCDWVYFPRPDSPSGPDAVLRDVLSIHGASFRPRRVDSAVRSPTGRRPPTLTWPRVAESAVPIYSMQPDAPGSLPRPIMQAYELESENDLITALNYGMITPEETNAFRAGPTGGPAVPADGWAQRPTRSFMRELEELWATRDSQLMFPRLREYTERELQEARAALETANRSTGLANLPRERINGDANHPIFRQMLLGEVDYNGGEVTVAPIQRDTAFLETVRNALGVPPDILAGVDPAPLGASRSVGVTFSLRSRQGHAVDPTAAMEALADALDAKDKGEDIEPSTGP